MSNVCVQPTMTFKSSVFPPQNVLMHVGFSEQNPIIYLNGMNQLLFRVETEFVRCEVGGACLYKVQMNFR
jgi:hypothetical protein